MRPVDRQPTLISSVQRALHLLDAVSAHPNGVPAKVLARETGLPLATTYHLLRTLQHEGYLRKLEDGSFVLGDHVEAIGERGRNQLVLTRIRPILAALRDELAAAAYLCIYRDGEIRVEEIVDAPSTPRVDLWVGFTDAGHATALGKCVLRQLAGQDRRDYLSRHQLADLTPRTATRRADLLHRLTTSMSGPLMLDRQEYALGTSCAAVPVSDGYNVGALGVSVPAAKLGRIAASANRLVSTGQRVTRTLSLTG